MQQCGKKYFDERNGNNNSVSMLGAPHLHVWKAMIEAIVQIGNTTTQKLSPTVQQDLKLLREHLATMFNIEELQDVVHVCRITNTFQEGKCKIIIMTA
eukprot:13903567-Heterocapsa_arctica.AAC.1